MSRWTETEFARRLNISYPIIQGPFGRGGSSALLAATVSNAKGLGSYGANDQGSADIIKIAADIRKLTPLEPFTFDPCRLGPEEVEIEVSYCAICHSDLSMLNNDWGTSKYPFVPGHEVTGTVSALESKRKDLKPDSAWDSDGGRRAAYHEA